MAKLSYNHCCIDKIYKYIYKKNIREYNYIDCCNHIYYILPHEVGDLRFCIIRENSDNNYYYVDKNKSLHKLFSISDYQSPDQRDIELVNIIKKINDEIDNNPELFEE